jgi:hypothetical protein
LDPDPADPYRNYLASRSVIKIYGAADPDPNELFTDPELWVYYIVSGFALELYLVLRLRHIFCKIIMSLCGTVVLAWISTCEAYKVQYLSLTILYAFP